MYHRFGHASEHFVELGDKVKKGQKILSIGTGNGQWSAHCHKDSPRKKMADWEFYTFGMTLPQVKENYAEVTREEIKTIMPQFDHFGYENYEHANYGTDKVPKWCYHPGVDLNGKGAGNSDLGVPIFSPCDGEVIFDFDDGKAKNGGWGKLLVIQETEQKPKIEITPVEVEQNNPTEQIPENKPPENLPVEPLPSEPATIETPVEQVPEIKTIEQPASKLSLLQLIWDFLVFVFGKVKK